jgi:hypothetical protein
MPPAGKIGGFIGIKDKLNKNPELSFNKEIIQTFVENLHHDSSLVRYRIVDAINGKIKKAIYQKLQDLTKEERNLIVLKKLKKMGFKKK